ncbi:MAG TPA: universal stress protein [Coriobacteriia bacterium]
MTSRLDNTAANIADDQIGMVSYSPRRILVPTDGSATAVEATYVAVGLARTFGSEVIALFVDPSHVVDPIEEEMVEQSEGVHHSTAGLHLAAVAGERNGVTVRTLSGEGATAHAILQVAEDEDCDLIVIGNTGRRGMQRMMLGSVAEAVVRDADIPVLVVKHCSTAFCTKMRTDS